MASPVFEIRLPPELKVRCQEAADAQGVSLSAWFKIQAQAGLHVFDGEAPVVDKPVKNCKHPRDQRKILTYATFCTKCSARVR